MQAEAVRFLTAVLPELGAKYPRLIFGVQTVPPSLKNSVPVQAELLPLRTRSLLEKNGSSIVFDAGGAAHRLQGAGDGSGIPDADAVSV